jgi:hypothetical protein
MSWTTDATKLGKSEAAQVYHVYFSQFKQKNTPLSLLLHDTRKRDSPTKKRVCEIMTYYGGS